MLARTANQICRFHKDQADRYVDGAINIWMSAHALAMLQSLILVTAANGAPLLLARLVGARFAYPIDGGMVLSFDADFTARVPALRRSQQDGARCDLTAERDEAPRVKV